MSIQFAVRFAALFAVVSLLPVFGGAQQTTPPSKPDSATPSPPQAPSPDPAAPKDQQAPADKEKGTKGTNDNNQGKIAGTSNDRLFYTLPNFLSVENTAQVPPLTTKQKFAVVARATFDPVEFPWWGILSAIDQADNSEPAYGQGWGAFGKRYGTTAGDSLVENFMVGAVFPSVLHQDPRFFQKSQGGFGSRAWYAVTRILVTRTDSGHSQFNYSEIFGSATGAAISTFTYHPRSTFISTPTNPHMFIGSDRTLVNAADVWATQISLDTVTIVVKEFWPDIHRKISKKARQPQVDTANP